MAVNDGRFTSVTHRFRRGPIRWLRRGSFVRVDPVLTAGRASTEAVLAPGVPPDRIVTGLNAVDVDMFRAVASEIVARLTHTAGHHVLYVGQLMTRKNVEFALRSWALTRALDDTFTIVGTGPMLDYLSSVTEQLGLTPFVRFTGHLQGRDFIKEYARANTFRLPSTEEVRGLVVNEALAAGLHAGVSDTAGMTPSIEGMCSVFSAAPEVGVLSHGLISSRGLWSGPIDDSEILTHTSEHLVEAVLTAAAGAQPVFGERQQP